MEMISQVTESIQQVTENIQQEMLKNVLGEVPIVLVDNKNKAFLLIRDINEELEEFIRTGIANYSHKYSVFPEEYEQEIIKQCLLAGFRYTYRRQKLEYKFNVVTIIYIQIYNPNTGLNISLVPWFLLKDRPYPIFVYLYAILHYFNSEQKSMQRSAMVTSAIFGVIKFNKSTLCRSIKAMKCLISDFQMESPLSVEESDIPSSEEIISRILDLLNNCPTIDTLAKECQVKTGSLPPPVRDADEVSYAFSKIPKELFDALKTVKSVKSKVRDLRRRRTRKRKREYKSEQHELKFVESARIDQIRLEFIAVSKTMVMNAAIVFHRFLN